MLSFAGLWDQWHNVETGERVASCTIIVTAANDATRAIHDRMPVVLAKPDVDAWLAGAAGPELLQPAPSDALRLWPVSRRVNRTGQADDPSLIEPLAEALEHTARPGNSMTKRPRSQPGEPMDLANMRSLGIRSLAVTCELCHHAAVVDVARWPGDVPVPAFAPRMVCTRCGIVGADARPNWKEQPQRAIFT